METFTLRTYDCGLLFSTALLKNEDQLRGLFTTSVFIGSKAAYDVFS